MVIVRITKMFKRNTFGDYAAVTVSFNAFDKHGHHMARKELTGKIGVLDARGKYQFQLFAGNAAEVRADIPNGATCECEVVKS
jgi:hypothetical protein